MTEYIYPEEKYFNGPFNDFQDLLARHDFAPSEIPDDDEFFEVLEIMVDVIEESPQYIPAYEYALEMLYCLEPDREVKKLIKDLDGKRLTNCLKIAEKDRIFDKKVEWGWIENRPLIRGIYSHADNLWKEGKLKEANELFSKIYKTNENDNIGARYSVKATAEGMSFKEFEKKFIIEDEMGSYYRTPELWEWYGE